MGSVAILLVPQKLPDVHSVADDDWARQYDPAGLLGGVQKVGCRGKQKKKKKNHSEHEFIQSKSIASGESI